MAHDSSTGDDSPAAERHGGIVNAVTDRLWQKPDRHFLTTWELLSRAKNAHSPAYARFPPGRQAAPSPVPPLRKGAILRRPKHARATSRATKHSATRPFPQKIGKYFFHNILNLHIIF